MLKLKEKGKKRKLYNCCRVIYDFDHYGYSYQTLTIDGVKYSGKLYRIVNSVNNESQVDSIAARYDNTYKIIISHKNTSNITELNMSFIELCLFITD